MPYLYKIWEWLGDNSAQLQILVAFFAFWLAYQAYKKVLEQIKISQEQSNFAILKEKENFRLNILNLINQNLEKIGTIIIRIPILQSEFERIYQELINRKDEDLNIIYKEIKSLEK